MHVPKKDKPYRKSLAKDISCMCRMFNVYLAALFLNKGRDTLTPLPFVVMWDMFWQRRSASYFVN